MRHRYRTCGNVVVNKCASGIQAGTHKENYGICRTYRGVEPRIATIARRIPHQPAATCGAEDKDYRQRQASAKSCSKNGGVENWHPIPTHPSQGD